jgi:uncharacterized protein YndB with AHSA1/START domain
MTDPLVVEFEVDVAPARAFEVWTRRCATWWPSSHTISGDPSAITFEPRPGGRIVEHAPGGGEHDWGEVLEWDPPSRLRYLWHLFFDPSEATEVEVTFSPLGERTAVRLEQRGWERLGDAAPARRTRTQQAWGTIGASFRRACLGITAAAERRLPAHVVQADGDEIVIAAVDPRGAAQLGFTDTSRGEFARTIRSDAEKANVLQELRDAGFCFARGREWSPAEVFEWLCERGLLSGQFRSLSYTAPGRFHVREEQC